VDLPIVLPKDVKSIEKLASWTREEARGGTDRARSAHGCPLGDQSAHY
jgi:hypothetical protein